MFKRSNESYSCGSNLFIWIAPIAILIVLCIILSGCVTQSDNISSDRNSKYERVKSAAGNDLYKIQIFCPGKTMTYVSSGGSYINQDYARFEDYLTGEEVQTTCPVVQYPILRKRKTSFTSGPEELDELLKNDVVGMMDKAKTPVEQVPVVEESKKSDVSQPSTQSNITINNYNK